MGEALLAGLAAGYGIAIPVGAIAVLIIETAVRHGLRPGLAAGTGAASADGLYAFLAALAGTAIAGAVAPFLVPLRTASVAVLVAIALRGLLAARRSTVVAGGRPQPDGAIGPGVIATYLRFLGLTLLNPMTVVYFAALIVGLPAIGDGLGERLAFVLAAFVASLTWQWVLAGFGAFLHHRLPPRAALLTSLVGNLIILAFAARIALDVVAAV